MFPIAVLASGRGSNLRAILEAQQNNYLQAQVGLVISDNPEAGALKIAQEFGVNHHVLDFALYDDKEDYNRRLIKLLTEAGIQLVVLAGYMRLLSPAVVEAFPYKIINIHPSLLPAFPGLAAQRQALDYGVKFTGCTVHFVDKGMDTGPIIGQRVVPVLANDTLEELTNRILKEEHILYPQMINRVATNKVRIINRRVAVQEEEKDL
ncbi:MAG: phosphoribosylglycinamide formyltransferase [Bacillota bacterium]